ncbi:MAG: class I SAM-dependent methyltransferase [Elusimicrobia bacterium]|nr:class I SAM-dependent methyltransferase [Elusimicrobiota bacterium]
MSHDDRSGAKQPHRFDPKKAALLDDPARLEYLPPAEVAALLDAPRGGLVADFGTGTGLYALELARLRPDLSFAAIDEQDRMLALLRDKLAARPAPNVRPVLSGTPEAAALAGRVDRALALNVLHELGDSALAELAGLLAPGGRALFVDWNAAVERPFGPPRDHVLSPAEARARLERLGWRVAHERLFRFHYALAAAPAR